MSEVFTADQLAQSAAAVVIAVQGDDAVFRMITDMGIKPGLELKALGIDPETNLFHFKSSVGLLELPLHTCQRIVIQPI